MADPLISLDTEHAFVQPGGQARVTVTVTNTGTLVEGYWLQVLGPLAPWAEVVPPEVSVYPQQEITAAVVFSPPTGTSVLGGLQPFGVMAQSTLDSQISAVAEGDIEIGEVYGLQAKIIPVTSAGRWRGRHVIQLSNWGNAWVQLQMTASDPDEALGFYVSPAIVNLPPGGYASVRVSARTRHPFLRGTPVRLPFQVVGQPLDAEAEAPPAPGTGYGDPSRPVVDAALNQKPILSRGFVTLAVMLLAGIIGFGAYLYFKPADQADILADRGFPPKPQNLQVTTVEPESVGLRWDKVELAEHYNLQHIDPPTNGVTKVDEVNKDVTITKVAGLPPRTEVCFRLTVTWGGQTGPESDRVCATTSPPPTPTPTPTPTPDPATTPTSTTPTPTDSTPASPTVTPGDPNTDPLMKQAWIAVAAELPKSGHLEFDALAEVKNLTEHGLPDAKHLDSRFYPKLVVLGATPSPTPLPEESFLVYLGPFPTQVDAMNRCADITNATGGSFCVAAQPDPL